MLYSIFKNYISIFVFLVLLTNCSGTRPPLIGQFPPCPNTPNCVSSKSAVSFHKIDPITYQGTYQKARENLLNIIKTIPRTKISIDENKFLHVKFTSNIFRFIDDVEFYFNDTGIIHIRSASRVGYSDMGVNRNRVEKIRKLFAENLSTSIQKAQPN